MISVINELMWCGVGKLHRTRHKISETNGKHSSKPSQASAGVRGQWTVHMLDILYNFSDHNLVSKQLFNCW